MQFGSNFLFSSFYQEEKARISTSVITIWFWFEKYDEVLQTVSILKIQLWVILL